MKEAELPNIVNLLAHAFKGLPAEEFLLRNENIIFSLLVMGMLTLCAFFATRKKKLQPGRLQNALEFIVEIVDDFVCGVLGRKGRKYTPFIGTLFIYILVMNLIGLVPFFKSSTASWSTTLALALCVFVYVQYTALKELGFLGYLDHLAGNPRGIVACTVVVPVLMFCIHLITELVKPMTLSLRLRCNIWGDDFLLTLLTGYGLPGIPLLLFSTLITVLASVIQALVFCLLVTVYFALVMKHEDEPHTITQKG